MKTSLYLFNSGRLERKQNTLRFINERQKRYIPVTTIQDLHLFGEVDINTSALNFLGQHGISLHSYNYYNSYTGSYLPRKRSGNGQLTKLKQVELLKYLGRWRGVGWRLSLGWFCGFVL